MNLSPELLAQLYTADPDEFMAVRTSLAADAKQSGDAELSRSIAAQRKPTVAAWVVNRQVHTDPAAVDRLLELGTRLRAAQEQLDASRLRELSTERRQLVAQLSDAALTGADRGATGANLRDEVGDTFDAAVADPQIAARLGRLTRAEKYSGFGVAMDAPSGAPELTVIRGGRDRSTRTSTGTAARKAAAALGAADTALHDSEGAEQTAAQRVRDLTAELSRVEQELAAAKADHDQSRQEVRSARTRRRQAQAALARTERAPED